MFLNDFLCVFLVPQANILGFWTSEMLDFLYKLVLIFWHRKPEKFSACGGLWSMYEAKSMIFRLRRAIDYFINSIRAYWTCTKGI